jgi:hypothetical protein
MFWKTSGEQRREIAASHAETGRMKSAPSEGFLSFWAGGANPGPIASRIGNFNGWFALF